MFASFRWDGRPHLAPAHRQYAGDSRGHWEGDTLVVETINLKGAFIRRWNRPENSLARGDLSEAVHVVERFTRVGPDTLDYEIHGGRPGHLDETVERILADGADRGADLRVCVSRVEPRLDEHLAGSRAEDAR